MLSQIKQVTYCAIVFLVVSVCAVVMTALLFPLFYILVEPNNIVTCRAPHFIELLCQTPFCLCFIFFFVILLSAALHFAPADVFDFSCLL